MSGTLWAKGPAKAPLALIDLRSALHQIEESFPAASEALEAVQPEDTKSRSICVHNTINLAGAWGKLHRAVRIMSEEILPADDEAAFAHPKFDVLVKLHRLSL